MTGQLSLGLEPPTTTGRGRSPAPANAPKVAPKPDGRDPHVVLEEWCDQEECLIFLWGANPHICNARSHSSRDPGLDRWVKRKRAEEILAAYGYVHTSNQIKREPGSKIDIKAKVYRRRNG